MSYFQKSDDCDTMKDKITSPEHQENKLAEEIFSSLNDSRAVRWYGLSDGGKWTRAIEAMKLLEKECNDHANAKIAELEKRLAEMEKERDDQLRLFANWIHDAGYEPTFVENVWCNMGNEKYFQTEQLLEQFKSQK